MAAVTELQVFAAVRDKLLNAGSWVSTKPIHFGRRPPGSAVPPYTVINVSEDTDADVESDGAAGQEFAVELAVKAVGPEDAQDAIAAVTALDPAWPATDTGLTLAGTNQSVVAVLPKTGRLRLIPPLASSNDQYDAVRRWKITTAALLGA